jgi:hypothetical protein
VALRRQSSDEATLVSEWAGNWLLPLLKCFLEWWASVVPQAAAVSGPVVGGTRTWEVYQRWLLLVMNLLA